MDKIYYEDEDMPYKHTRLVFPREWIGTKLPARWEHPLDAPRGDQTRHFLIELLDTEDGGKIYQARSWPHYEQTYPGDEVTSVHIYMFLEHYCPCHRKSDAEAAGADTDDLCEGERFVVKSITAPEHLPGVVLYSEVDDAKTLTQRCLT